MKDERGFVLPLLLGILLIMSALILGLASQIEIKTASYGRVRTYLRLNVAEQTGRDYIYQLITNATENQSLHNRIGKLDTLRNGIFSYEIVVDDFQVLVFYDVYLNAIRRHNQIRIDQLDNQIENP